MHSTTPIAEAAPPAVSPRRPDEGGVPENVRSILQRFADLETKENANFFRALAFHLGGSASDPCLPLYFRFALSCNERGREAADLIERFVPLRGKRVLDVGCAYGGFLVALAERGAIPTGFDIDAALLRLAERNFEDFGRKFDVHVADVTRAGDVGRFRSVFHVITCNDVIEHVADPAIAIVHIASMLKRGGLAYFEIPNRDYVSFVVEDGHYQQFGITQLDHEEAAAYYDAVAPGVAYGVAHYLRLPEYQALFGRAGLELQMLPNPPTARTVDETRWLVEHLRVSLDEKLAGVPVNVRPRVERAVRDYIDHAVEAGKGDPKAFVDRYGVAFWRVVARKPSWLDLVRRRRIRADAGGANE